MRCPFCSHEETQVVETRESDEGDVVRRRRRCQSCDKRFTTYEKVELRMPRLVKKDGSRTDFDRDKLAGSMMLALRKRQVATDKVDAAIDRIEEKLRITGERERAGHVLPVFLAEHDYFRRGFFTSRTASRKSSGVSKLRYTDANRM